GRRGLPRSSPRLTTTATIGSDPVCLTPRRRGEHRMLPVAVKPRGPTRGTGRNDIGCGVADFARTVANQRYRAYCTADRPARGPAHPDFPVRYPFEFGFRRCRRPAGTAPDGGGRGLPASAANPGGIRRDLAR